MRWIALLLFPSLLFAAEIKYEKPLPNTPIFNEGYAYIGFHDGWTARSYTQAPYFPPITRRDMSAGFSKSFQYTMPFFYDLTHLPLSAPMWQRGMLASAAALEITSLAFPAARLGIPLAERSIYHLR